MERSNKFRKVEEGPSQEDGAHETWRAPTTGKPSSNKVSLRQAIGQKQFRSHSSEESIQYDDESLELFTKLPAETLEEILTSNPFQKHNEEVQALFDTMSDGAVDTFLLSNPLPMMNNEEQVIIDEAPKEEWDLLPIVDPQIDHDDLMSISDISNVEGPWIDDLLAYYGVPSPSSMEED